MKKITSITLFLVFFLSGTKVIAQEKKIVIDSFLIHGILADWKNKKPIAFTDIAVEDDGKPIAETVTDIDGHFTLKIASSMDNRELLIKCKNEGYKTYTHVFVPHQKENYLDCKVKAIHSNEDRIIIVPKCDLYWWYQTEHPGTTIYSKDDIQHMAKP